MVNAWIAFPDRVRDQRLMLLGWRVVPFPWQQVMYQPADVAATLRGLLRQAEPVARPD